MQDYRRTLKPANTNIENLTAYEYERLHEAYAKKKEKRLMKEGIEQGIEQGKSLGKSEGIEENKIETAKKLYESNVSMDIIKIATGFDEKQIRNICL